jgi:hypothetical protein
MSSYQGTRALDARLPHPSRHLRLLTVDAWDKLFVLHGIEAPATTTPFPGHGWTIQTDQGTTHRSAGAGASGGKTIWHWAIEFDSPLPADVTRITVSPGIIDNHPAPATTLTMPPVSITRPATTSHVTDDRRSPGCQFCNPVPLAATPAPSGSRCPVCWAAQNGVDRTVDEPDITRPRSIALSADLGNLAGADIALCSLNSWSTWFELTLAAQGDDLADRQGPRLVGRWDIEDDRGNSYTGVTTSSSSGASRLAYATCAPALDPRAQALTITFPDPFDHAGIINTTIALTA